MTNKKTISFAIPCYNEVGNVKLLSAKIIKLFENELSNYNYQIQFIDNCSTDGTREILRELCDSNKCIRTIFNAKNFPMGSAFHGIAATTGDCTIYMAADLQDPVEIIPEFVKKWEEGYIIVGGINKSHLEKKSMRFARSLYYSILEKLSQYEGNHYIKHFNGFGLYDKSFVEFMRSLDDPYPFLRTYISEFGYKVFMLPFERQRRHSGKSKLNFYNLYALTMRSITNSTKYLIRFFSFIGAGINMLSIITLIIYLSLCLIKTIVFDLNILVGLLIIFLCSLLMIFMGIIGEYILNINTRIMNRPLVIEQERINFDLSDKEIYKDM